jgi:hypothetical protein
MKDIPHTLVEQTLLTLQEHMSSPLVFSGVRITRSLAFFSVTVISDASSTGVQKSEMYFKWILFHVAR